jgi:hypothetical protein
MRVLVALYMYPKKIATINEYHVLCNLLFHFMYKSRMTTSLKFFKEYFFNALNFEDLMFLTRLDMVQFD